MAATIIKNIIVMMSSGGKVFKLDRTANIVTIYANESQYESDNPVGSVPSSEFLEVINLVKGQTTNE